jgi:hypothetical protein
MLAFFCLVSILIPSMGRARMPANVIKCGSNFRQIGQSLAEYTQAFGGRYPDYIEQILWQDVWSDLLTCPSSEEIAARGNTPAEVMAKIASERGHVSYTYIGRGLTSNVAPETVLLFEPLGHHPPKEGHKIDGGHVLFADGKVVYVPAADLIKLISELSAGSNPSGTAKRLHDAAP